MIWNYDLEEIRNGYRENEENYCCVICETNFEKGRIYPIEGDYYDAKGAVKRHIVLKHEGVVKYLLHQETGVTGLSEIQNNILTMLLEQKSDKEIGEKLGIAQSTVRNHKFKLREKGKQAKMLLAIMEALETETSKSLKDSDIGNLEEVHTTATMVDDRYSITDSERLKVISTYMDNNGKLKQLPAREKKKIIIFREIIKNFKCNTDYSEKEVNSILKGIYEEDYPTIRRALIEYGFMERTPDCSIYRVKE
jgi:hypothetical protein